MSMNRQKWLTFWGIVFLALGALLFLSLVLSGMYNPFGVARFYLDGNPWSSDSNEAEFRAKTRSTHHRFQVDTDGSDLRWVRKVEQSGRLSPPTPIESSLTDSEWADKWLEMTRLFGEIRTASVSPDESYILLITSSPASRFRLKSSQRLLLVDFGTNEIVSEIHISSLERVRIRNLFGLSITGSTCEKLTLFFFAVGILLVTPYLHLQKKRLSILVKGTIIFTVLYGLTTCYYLVFWLNS